MKTYVHKTLCKNVHRSFIHISSEMETAQMFINSSMGNQNMEYSYKGMLLSHKNE